MSEYEDVFVVCFCGVWAVYVCIMYVCVCGWLGVFVRVRVGVWVRKWLCVCVCVRACVCAPTARPGPRVWPDSTKSGPGLFAPSTLVSLGPNGASEDQCAVLILKDRRVTLCREGGCWPSHGDGSSGANSGAGET